MFAFRIRDAQFEILRFEMMKTDRRYPFSRCRHTIGSSGMWCVEDVVFDNNSWCVFTKHNHTIYYNTWWQKLSKLTAPTGPSSAGPPRACPRCCGPWEAGKFTGIPYARASALSSYALAYVALNVPRSGQNLTHQKSQNMSAIGKCHWQYMGTLRWTFHWERDTPAVGYMYVYIYICIYIYTH